jgi:hypothetical protein
MTRRTVLGGLLDVPDWLLLPWACAMGLAQWLTRLPEQRVIRIRGKEVSVSHITLGAELRERLLLAVVITVMAWLLPAIIRRSVRRWRGLPSHGEQGMFDAPFHRDPLFWIAVLFWVPAMMNGNLLPHLEFTGSSSGPGHPLREAFHVRGTYAWTLAGLVVSAALTSVSIGIAAVVRSWYRRLGDPSVSWSGRRRRRLHG